MIIKINHNNINSFPLVILLKALIPDDNAFISFKILRQPPNSIIKKEISAESIKPKIGYRSKFPKLVVSPSILL